MMSFQVPVISQNFRWSEADRRRPQRMRRPAEQHGSQPDSLAPQRPPELQIEVAGFELDVNRSWGGAMRRPPRLTASRAILRAPCRHTDTNHIVPPVGNQLLNLANHPRRQFILAAPEAHHN